VLQGHVIRLTKGKSHAFEQWTDDDVELARKYTNVFDTERRYDINPAVRVYEAARKGDDWKIQRGGLRRLRWLSSRPSTQKLVPVTAAFAVTGHNVHRVVPEEVPIRARENVALERADDRRVC
jgi:hypothetical protein